MHEEDAGTRMKVWRWFGRDPSSGFDLEFLVATTSKKDLHRVSVQLGLPKEADAYLVKASDPAFDVAMERPGHGFWREPGVDVLWQDERALEEFRRTSGVRLLSAGQYREPLHRPDPD
jgi:hypothetical protein